MILRCGPLFGRTERSPPRDARAVQPVHLAGLEDGALRRRPDPADILLPLPSAVVIREPAPRLIRHPGVAQAVIPPPAALLVRSPAIAGLRLPHRAEVFGLNPLAGT